MNYGIVTAAGAQSCEPKARIRRCDSPPFSDRGASAVEYALLVGLIAVVIFGAVAVVGLNLGGLYDNVATSISDL